MCFRLYFQIHSIDLLSMSYEYRGSDKLKDTAALKVKQTWI